MTSPDVCMRGVMTVDHCLAAPSKLKNAEPLKKSEQLS